MTLTLGITPSGRPIVEADGGDDDAALAPALCRVRDAFEGSSGAGLLYLATRALTIPLTAPLAFARELASDYLGRLCRTPDLGLEGNEVPPVLAPPLDELAARALQAPPMKGLEYLSADVLNDWWMQLDAHAREQVRRHPGGAREYLREANAVWQSVGRVTFHLAENKRDESHPFAFLATYASRVSAQGRVQHLPLGRALQEYAGAKDRSALVGLLTPVQRASDAVPWVKEMVESGGVYRPLAWTPREAYRFLKDLPLLEGAGLIVRVPDWWKPAAPPRAQVSVRIGETAQSRLGADALLEFSVGVALDGQPLSERELEEALASSGGLVRLRGQWVEVDRERLAAALEHWKAVEREARGGGVTFFEGMRLLAGAGLAGDGVAAAPEAVRAWTGVAPGAWLETALAELRDPDRLGPAAPAALRAHLRHYQETGVNWLRFMSRLGLGACLADDMGLGKTVQVIALLLHERARRGRGSDGSGGIAPDLLVVPASLVANWKAEIERFAPSLSVLIAHPSEADPDLFRADNLASALAGRDVVITTYGVLTRTPGLREAGWNVLVLDEAQAIKNPGTRQAKAVKEVRAATRVALTGTPIENRLGDLWSLFDFLNPGLLGGAKAFGRFVKDLERREHNPYGPLRSLVRPYILRRLKTDRSVIADLPEKTEVKAYCTLTRRQATLYEQAVRELGEHLAGAEGIGRKGVVLASLMRLKQICNHPAQWTGDGDYDPALSGKFARVTELAEELASRQEKALIFTQFKEITSPLAEHLAGVFGRPGLVLHGGTPLPRRREMVEAFAREDGPPFFVLSLKAGGTGLNLTAAAHVIHFDRWWNPGVENQATDRAFRIGQKNHVFVHKFVCRGTVEERIDALIGDKVGLAEDLLRAGEGTDRMLTEMSDRELLSFVSLDLSKAVDD